MKCLRPDCQRKPLCRGLCASCYTIASQIVKTGQLTWEELEKQGRSKPLRGQCDHVRHWLLTGNTKSRSTEAA